jgi:excisionase family DNA binding protein
MVKDNPITIPQLAKLLGVSRIAIYKKVKNGQIPAKKAGKVYIISDRVVEDILGKKLSLQKKKQIDTAVGKTVKQYGEVLKRLGKE